MAHYPFPNFIGSSARLTTFQGEPSIQYTANSDYELRMAHLAGGKRFLTDVFLPTVALRPNICPPNVEVYRIDSTLRIYHLRERSRTFENMQFPKVCMALVIDTDLPVSQFFADNLCAYSTGLIGMGTTAAWMSKFYEEMSIGSDPTPFAKISCLIVQDKKLYPSSPWPTPGWSSNGLYSIVNNFDQELLNGSGGKITTTQLLTEYQWPARMSVAIFFTKKLSAESVEYNILKARAHKFCKLCPEGKFQFHKITDFRWVDTCRLKFWNEYEDEPEPVKSYGCLNRKKCATESYDSFWDNKLVEVRRPQRVKIEIEDITTNTYEL